MSYFITGGAGFIGSCIANQLIARGERVVVFDNLFAGKRTFLDARATVIECDLLDVNGVRSAIQQHKPKAVLHLAALHFIPYCNAHPEETIRINVEGTYGVLHACADASIERVVLASSGALYADKSGLIHEDDLIQPYDVYGVSKHMTEIAGAFFAQRHAMQVVVTRFFNTYGPNETQPHLIPTIIEQLKRGNDITLGNVQTKRDYIYVEDLAAGVVACADAALSGPNFVPLNIGTGVEYSAAEIVETMADILGRRLNLTSASALVRKSDKMHQTADTRRIHALTDWQAHYSLRDGLTKLLRFEGLI